MSTEAATTTEAGAATQEAQQTSTEATTGSQSTEAGQATTEASKAVWDDPAAARAEIEKLRKQNGDERVNAKKQAAEEARNELLQKLGLTKDGEPAPDPAKVAADLAAEREARAATARELAIFKAASAAGADPAKLLDSNSFLTSVKGLDPADGDAIAAAITAAVSANASLKAARAAGASGIEQTGGTGEQGQITEQQLKTMSPEQIVAAQEKGLLRNLLG